MSQTVNLTQSTAPLGLEQAWRSAPLVISGTVSNPEAPIWRAQIWRRPQDYRDGATGPLATANGVVTNGVATMAFTASQMNVELLSDDGRYDDLWLSVSGLNSSSQPLYMKGDWLRVLESGFDPEVYTTTAFTWRIRDDIIYIENNEGTYRLQGVEDDDPPSGVLEGAIIVILGNAYFTAGSRTWRAQVVEDSSPPSGMVDGQIVIINDNAYYTSGSRTWRAEVVEEPE